MGIDVYLKWKGQTEEEHKAQYTGFSVVHGHVGYLREAYHGQPYATRVLLPECFDDLPEEGSGVERVEDYACKYPASVLEARLPETIFTVIERGAQVYKEVLTEDDPVVQAFVNFVNLAKQKEQETGEPCIVEVSG